MFQKLVKTSELSAQEKKVWANTEKIFIIKVAASTELFLILWLKEVILLSEMELEVNQSMELNLMMKISKKNTQKEVNFQWPIQDLAPMDHNSS